MDKNYYNLTTTDPKFNVGPGQRVITDEHRENMRIGAKNRLPMPQETRDKMSKTRKGRPSPLKGRTKPAGSPNGMRGKHWYNDGISEHVYFFGHQPKDWVIGKIKGKYAGENNPFYGKTHSEETKKTISEHNKGKNMGDDNPARRPEVRAKISAATIGKAKRKHANREENTN